MITNYLKKVIEARRIYKRRNEDIRKKLKVKSVKREIGEKKLKWAGNMIKLNETLQVKTVCNARGREKNKTGMPRQTWNNNVNEILEKRGKSSMINLLQFNNVLATFL